MTVLTGRCWSCIRLCTCSPCSGSCTRGRTHKRPAKRGQRRNGSLRGAEAGRATALWHGCAKPPLANVERRGHQRPSEATRGHTRGRPSEAIRGHQRPPEAIGGHQRPSEANKGHQRPPEAIRRTSQKLRLATHTQSAVEVSQGPSWEHMVPEAQRGRGVKAQQWQGWTAAR